MGGKGCVYWRAKAKTWQVRVKVGGRTVYKSGFSTKAAGQRWLSETTREAERAELLGLTPVRTDLTLEPLIPRWLTSIRPRVSGTTYDNEEASFGQTKRRLSAMHEVPWPKDAVEPSRGRTAENQRYGDW